MAGSDGARNRSPIRLLPALFTRTSIRPSFSMTSLTASFTDVSLSTSSASRSMLELRPSILDTFRADAYTLHPRRANSSELEAWPSKRLRPHVRLARYAQRGAEAAHAAAGDQHHSLGTHDGARV
jgi:hypothetical protein